MAYDGKTVERPGYGERIAQMVGLIWPQHTPPYAVLSAVAHAELPGLTRSLSDPGDGLDPRPDPAGSTLWLWWGTYLVLGALMFTAERAARFLGSPDQFDALHAWTADLDRALPALRPVA